MKDGSIDGYLLPYLKRDIRDAALSTAACFPKGLALLDFLRRVSPLNRRLLSGSIEGIAIVMHSCWRIPTKPFFPIWIAVNFDALRRQGILIGVPVFN